MTKRATTPKTKRKRRPLAVTQVRKGATRARGPQLLGKHYLTIGLDDDLNNKINEIAGNTHEDLSVICRNAIRSALGMSTISGDQPKPESDGKPEGYFREDAV